MGERSRLKNCISEKWRNIDNDKNVVLHALKLSKLKMGSPAFIPNCLNNNGESECAACQKIGKVCGTVIDTRTNIIKPICFRCNRLLIPMIKLSILILNAENKITPLNNSEYSKLWTEIQKI